MRTIIAGSRGITDYGILEKAVKEAPFKVTTVISGRTRGVDQLGEEYAKRNNIPLELYPANWDLYKKAAGAIRNSVMSEKAEALIAVWDGSSKGTKDMINKSRNKGLMVFVYKVYPIDEVTEIVKSMWEE